MESIKHKTTWIGNIMRTIAVISLLTMPGCGRSAPPRMNDKILEWVPWGTSLESAQQAMDQQHFTCSVVTYDRPEQMTGTAEVDAVVWKTVTITNGVMYPVTNVAHLICVRTNCTVTFTLANGRTTRLSASGSLR